MGFKCGVQGCTHEGQSGLVQLPANHAICQRLLMQLGFPDGFAPWNTFRVCTNHFTPESMMKRGRGNALIANPTVIGHEAEFNAMEITDEAIVGIQFLKDHFPQSTLDLLSDQQWYTQITDTKDSSVHFWRMKFDPKAGVKASVSVDHKMRVRAWKDHILVRNDYGLKKLHTWTELNELLTQLSHDEPMYDNPNIAVKEIAKRIYAWDIPSPAGVKDAYDICANLLENVNNLRPRYNIGTMMMAHIVKNLSPKAYECLRGFIPLPSPNYLIRQASSENVMDNDKWFRTVRKQHPDISAIGFISVDDMKIEEKLMYKSLSQNPTTARRARIENIFAVPEGALNLNHKGRIFGKPI